MNETTLIDEIKKLDADISESRACCEVTAILGVITVADGRKAQVTLTLNTDEREW